MISYKHLPSLLLFRNVNYVELLHVPRHPDDNVPRDLDPLEPVNRKVHQNLLPELLILQVFRGEIQLVLLIWEQNTLTDPELVAQQLVHILNLFKCGLLFVQLTNSRQLEIVPELLGPFILFSQDVTITLSWRLKSYQLRFRSLFTSFSTPISLWLNALRT